MSGNPVQALEREIPEFGEIHLKRIIKAVLGKPYDDVISAEGNSFIDSSGCSADRLFAD